MTGRIRTATLADAEPILEIYGPVVERTFISFETEPPSLAEMRGRIERVTGSLPWLVLERSNGIVGYAYASRHNDRAAYQWSVDVAVYVREGERRQGAASALYDSLFSCLRLLGVRNAVAIIALPNPASVGFHEALGFRRVALFPGIGFKLSAWRDVGHWLLRLQEGAEPPEPLSTPGELGGTAAWRAAVASGVGRFRS